MSWKKEAKKRSNLKGQFAYLEGIEDKQIAMLNTLQKLKDKQQEDNKYTGILTFSEVIKLIEEAKL